MQQIHLWSVHIKTILSKVLLLKKMEEFNGDKPPKNKVDEINLSMLVHQEIEGEVRLSQSLQVFKRQQTKSKASTFNVDAVGACVIAETKLCKESHLVSFTSFADDGVITSSMSLRRMQIFFFLENSHSACVSAKRNMKNWMHQNVIS